MDAKAEIFWDAQTGTLTQLQECLKDVTDGQLQAFLYQETQARIASIQHWLTTDLHSMFQMLEFARSLPLPRQLH